MKMLKKEGREEGEWGWEGGGGENVIRGYISACESVRVARCGRQAACALPQRHKEKVEFAIWY